MKPIYSVPKLKSYDDLSKTWYVWFRYNGQLIKKTQEINRIKDCKLRTVAGHALAKVYHDELKKGWNPLAPDIDVKADYMTINEALDFAMEKKKINISHKTFLDYSCTVRFCKTAAESLSLSSMSIGDVKMIHIKLIMERATKLNKWSGKSYNKHLGYLKAVISELLQWQILEHNPAHNIKTVKVNQETANIPPTPEQTAAIKASILDACPDFWDFVLVIYHTGIRPVEITQIQDKMINRAKRLIILPPTITKTPKERIVPINNHLWAVLEPRLGYGKDYYIFGTECPDMGYKKGHRQYVPAAKKMKRATPTRLWEKIVKIGLEMDVNLYAMKKAGANDKILAGISRRAIQEMYGHASALTTEIYITNLKEVLHNEILEKSPAL